MDGNDINSILDNICEKLGTTAKMLIPEMAGYMISKWAICIVLGVIFMMRYVYYNDSDYFPPAFGLTLFFFIGAVLLCVGITQIIGWSLSPNAMTVMWIVDNIGKQ